MFIKRGIKFKKLLYEIEHSTEKSIDNKIKKIRELLKSISDEKIIEAIGMAEMSKLVYLLSLKYNEKPKIIPIQNDLMIRVGKCNVANMSYLAVYLHFLKFEKGTLLIEGTVSYPALIGKCEFGVNINGKSQIIEDMTDMNLDLKFGEYIYETRTAFAIKIEEMSELDIIFFNRHDGIDINYGRINSMRFSPIADCIKNQYFWKDGYIFYIEKNQLIAKKVDEKNLFFREEQFENAIKEYAPSKWEWASKLRTYFYQEVNKKTKMIWIFMDREDSADDNAKVLFKYVQKKKEIDSYFIISKNCKDYQKMCKIGKTIELYSEEHYKLVLIADFIISSQCNGVIENPFWEDSELFRDLYHRPKLIFLQHGVIKDDMSSTLNRFNTNFCGFLTSTKSEWESILKYPYFYNEKQVWLTGLPRYDDLKDQKEKVILLAPSWRKSNMEQVWDIKRKNMKWVLKKNFKKSDFFCKYKALLSNKRLQYVCRKYDYKILFMAHPLMTKYMEKFKIKSEFIILNEQCSYNEAFAKGALIITDYSSVAFDFLFLKKPVIYYQFDKEEFFEKHTYQPGYFDYEVAGLGPVVKKEQDLIDTVEKYLECECKLDKTHQKNVENLWQFQNKFCERVFNKLIEESM